MTANSSLILSNLDFDAQKNTFKQFLRAQDKYKDYDFEGSNMNVLLDVMSFNTYLNTFYLNMIGTEMFMDTAQQRDSVVSHAKDLNYTPRSFKSAEANVSVSIVSTDMSKRSVTIPKGQTFSSKYGTTSYTFSTNENILITDYSVGTNNITFSKNDIILYEGYYVVDTYTTNYAAKSRYLISNKTIDINSITVTVIEDGGDTVLTYSRAKSLFGLNGDSRVFFVQGAENETYEIIFGDDVIGRKPKDNSVVLIEGRICNGELPNGANQFTTDGTIDGESNITITVNQKAQGGAVRESTESIKFNAPRHFTTQERAVTPEDYENLLKENFAEINAVIAYGGEDLSPPQYGKVFVAVDLTEYDKTPDYKKTQYYNFIKPRASVNITPVFVDPDYMYLYVESDVNYNLNTTNLTPLDIQTIVTSAALNYSDANLNNFGKTFRYSNFTKAIDESQVSIVSNETRIRLVKEFVPTLGTAVKTSINFGTALNTIANDIFDSPKFGNKSIVKSSTFVYNNSVCELQDDFEGNLNIVSYSTQSAVIKKVGTVDYEKGIVNISDFAIDSFDGSAIKIIAIPKTQDIKVDTQNVILGIRREDISLNIIAVKE